MSDELHEALQWYGRHKDNCALLQIVADGKLGPLTGIECDCGFSRVMREITRDALAAPSPEATADWGGYPDNIPYTPDPPFEVQADPEQFQWRRKPTGWDEARRLREVLENLVKPFPWTEFRGRLRCWFCGAKEPDHDSDCTWEAGCAALSVAPEAVPPDWRWIGERWQHSCGPPQARYFDVAEIGPAMGRCSACGVWPPLKWGHVAPKADPSTLKLDPGDEPAPAVRDAEERVIQAARDWRQKDGGRLAPFLTACRVLSAAVDALDVTRPGQGE